MTSLVSSFRKKELAISASFSGKNLKSRFQKFRYFVFVKPLEADDKSLKDIEYMKNAFKPEGYNSVSPYFVVDDARRLMGLLIKIFDGKQLRSYDMPDGTIMHGEIEIDDSVLMFGNSSEQFPVNQLLTHIYVADVDLIYARAIELGCTPKESPKEREGDPDRRGSFKDFAGNMWSIGTQMK